MSVHDYVAFNDDGAAVAAVNYHHDAVVIDDDPSNIPIGSNSLRSAVAVDDITQSVHAHTLFVSLLGWRQRSLCNRATILGYFVLSFSLSLMIGTIAIVDMSSSSSKLTLWLLVTALILFSVSTLLLSILLLLILLSYQNNVPILLIPLLVSILIIELLFSFIWFIIGNVWFFLTPSTQTSPLSTRTSFFVILFVYVQVVLHSVLMLVAWWMRKGCPGIASDGSNANNDDGQIAIVLPGNDGAIDYARDNNDHGNENEDNNQLQRNPPFI